MFHLKNEKKERFVTEKQFGSYWCTGENLHSILQHIEPMLLLFNNTESHP